MLVMVLQLEKHVRVVISFGHLKSVNTTNKTSSRGRGRKPEFLGGLHFALFHRVRLFRCRVNIQWHLLYGKRYHLSAALLDAPHVLAAAPPCRGLHGLLYLIQLIAFPFCSVLLLAAQSASVLPASVMPTSLRIDCGLCQVGHAEQSGQRSGQR